MTHRWQNPRVLHGYAHFAFQVTITEKKSLVYDNYPKIRISGTDLGTLEASSLKLTFAPKLKANKDYKVDIRTGSEPGDKSYISLHLQPDKR